jgi:hypothetical protein
MNEDIFGLVGTTVDGKYRCDALVGEGGFGVVYRGWHLGFEVPVGNFSKSGGEVRRKLGHT